MANRPVASVSVSSTAGFPGAGSDLLCLVAPVAQNYDAVPRVFGSPSSLLTQHGYCSGVEFATLFIQRTRKPVLFCGVPITTAGTVGRIDDSGHTGTSNITLTAGANGVLHEHDGVLKVVRGGTVGTDQILLSLSLDGGRTFKSVRLGTSSSHVLPYVGASVAFGAGTLVTGQTVLTWHGTSPRADATGLAAARTALASQQKQFRSLLLGCDADPTLAVALNTQLEAYETANERYAFGRANIVDRSPLAVVSVTQHFLSGNPSLTFVEVGAEGDTITRSAGSWISDGFKVGDEITISGTSFNNVTAVIASLSATVITLGSEDLTPEVAANASVVGRPTLTFANSGDTVIRNAGSFIDDGFRVGDVVSVTGTSGASNDGDFEIVSLSELVMTLESGGVSADEVISTSDLTITAGQTVAAWVASSDAAFASIDGAPRISLGLGRGRYFSAIDNWYYRFPFSLAATIREYQHDLHIAPWRRSDGVTGFDLNDANGELTEYDDRVYGGAASLARFSSFTSSANGPQGAFISQSLTRAGDGDILSHTHNEAVTNLACATVHLATETVVIGATLVLNADGTATKESLSELEKEVNKRLHLALLQDNAGEGQRASLAVWVADPSTLFNVAEPTMIGTLDLLLNGTAHSVTTTVRVRTGG